MRPLSAVLLTLLAVPCLAADLTGNWAVRDPLPDPRRRHGRVGAEVVALRPAGIGQLDAVRDVEPVGQDEPAGRRGGVVHETGRRHERGRRGQRGAERARRPGRSGEGRSKRDRGVVDETGTRSR